MNIPKQRKIKSPLLEHQFQEQNEIENSFDRSYKKMMKKLYKEKPNKSLNLSPRSQALYDRIHTARKFQPKRLEFTEQNKEDSAQLNLSRFKYQELPDENSYEVDDILESDEMYIEDIFGEDQIVDPKHTRKGEEKEDSNKEIYYEDSYEIDDILHSDDMYTGDIFGEDQMLEPQHAMLMDSRKIEHSNKDNTILSKSLRERFTALKSLGLSQGQIDDHSYLSENEMDLEDMFNDSQRILPSEYRPERQKLRPTHRNFEPPVEINEYDSSSDDEHLQSYEIDELFGYEDENEEPLPLREIPMSLPKVTTTHTHMNYLARPTPHPPRTQQRLFLDSITDLSDESLPKELLELTQESIDSFLADYEMDIGDLFDQNNIMAPTDIIPSDKMAVLVSVAQTRKFKDLQKRLRRKRGEDDGSDENEVQNEALNRIMEEHLMYPTEFKSFREAKAILDRTIDKTNLPPPLLKSPQKTKHQPFREYAEKDLLEYYNYSPSKNEHLEEYELDELIGYDSEDEEPLPLNKIPFLKKTPTPRKRPINYLEKLTPLAPRTPRHLDSFPEISDESMPDEDLDEEQEISVVQSIPSPSNIVILQSIAQSRTLRDLKNRMRERRGESPIPEDASNREEDLNQLIEDEFFEQIADVVHSPANQQAELFANFEKDLDHYYNINSGEEHFESYELDDLVGYDDENEEPVNLGEIPMPQKTPTTQKQRKINYLSKPQPLPPREPRKLYLDSLEKLDDESLNLEDSVISQQSFLDENEMDISDMFGDDRLMEPSHLISPSKMALKMSVAQSNRIRNLRNRYRQEKGEPVIDTPEFQENVPAEFQRLIEEDEILNTPVRLPEFDKDLEEYYSLPSEDEHLQSYEVDELFGYDDEVDEPIPLKKIPIILPTEKTPSTPKKRKIQKAPRYFDHPSDEDFLNSDEMEYLFGDQDDEFAEPLRVRDVPIISVPRPVRKPQFVNYLSKPEPKRHPLPDVGDDELLDMEEPPASSDDVPSFLDLFVGQNPNPVKYLRADKGEGLTNLEESFSSKDGPPFVDLFVKKNKTPVKYIKFPRPEILNLKNRLEKIKIKTPESIKQSNYIPDISHEPFQMKSASTPMTGPPKVIKDYLQFQDEIGPEMDLAFMSPPKYYDRSFDDSLEQRRADIRRQLFNRNKIPTLNITPPTPPSRKQDRLADIYKEIVDGGPEHLDDQEEIKFDSDDSLESYYNRRPGHLVRPLYVLSDDEEQDKEPNDFEYGPYEPSFHPELKSDSRKIGRTSILPHEMDFKWLGEYRTKTPSPAKSKAAKKLEPRVAALTNRRALEELRKLEERKLEERKKVLAKKNASKKTVPLKKVVSKKEIIKKPSKPKLVPKNKK